MARLVSPSPAFWLTLVLSSSGAACGDTAAPSAAGDLAPVTCHVEHAVRSTCMVQLAPVDATRRLSLLAQCREEGGQVVEVCPTRDLIGVCEMQQNTARAWTLNAVTQVHHYMHPDAWTAEAAEAVAARCTGPTAQWTPAVDEAGD